MKERKHPEQDLQEKIITLLRKKGRPDLAWTAIGNGDLRHPVVALRLQRMGVTAGAPDMIFALDDGMTGWLELKSATGRLSHEQQGFGVKLMKLGHLWAVAKSMEQAVTILKDWNVFRANADLGAR